MFFPYDKSRPEAAGVILRTAKVHYEAITTNTGRLTACIAPHVVPQGFES